MVLGSMDGKISSDRFLAVLSSSDGRMLPVVVEVSVCA
jgi:hypothetical protein